MRYRVAAVVLALAAAVAIGQVPMYSDYPWGLVQDGVDRGPVFNLNCQSPLNCTVPSYGDGRIELGDGGTLNISVAFASDAGQALLAEFARDAGRSRLSDFADFASDAGNSLTSLQAGIALFALDAGLAGRSIRADFADDAGFAIFAGDAGRAFISNFSDFAADAGFSQSAALADVATFALDAGLANKAVAADFARDAGSAASADVSTFALDAGRATFATFAADAGLSVAALWAGDAGFSIGSGLAQYALDAGLANKAAAADFARDAGSAASADVSTFALDAGRAVFAGFAADAGLSVAALFAADAGNLQCTTCVDATDIATGAVTTPKISDIAVTTAKLDDGPSLSAYDEATVAGVSSRSTATNCTKGGFDGSVNYIRFTVNTVVTNPQVSTTLYVGTSTNARTPTAVMRYRLSGGFTSAPPSVIRAINNANGAQTADAPGVVADGAWHTATFDISSWTTAGTLRVDLLMPSTLATTGSWDISYLGTGAVGSGTGALVSYQNNVGIGNAIPSDKLTVSGAASTAVRIDANTATPGTGDEAQINMHSGDDFTRLFYRDSNSQFGIFHGVNGVNATKFRLTSTDMALMEAGGKVGIGKTNPQRELSVVGQISAAPSGTNEDVGYNGSFISTKASTANQHINIIRAGNRVWSLGFRPSSNTFLIAGGETTDSNFGNNQPFALDASGNVGIGTVAPAVRLHTTATNENLRMEGTDPWASFYQSNTRKGWLGYGDTGGTTSFSMVNEVSAGALRFDTNGGAYRFVDFNGGGTTGASLNNTGDLIRTVSDERLKENISDLSRGLDAVLRMRPVRFQWRDKEAFGPRWDIGFIAQEMIASVPEAVSQNPDGMYSLDYQKLIAVVVGAIQELFEDRTALAQRAQALEDRAEQAEARLAQLEARLLSLENYSGIKGCGNCPQTDDGENPP